MEQKRLGNEYTRRREQLARLVQPRLQGFFHQVNRQNGSEIFSRRLCVTSATPAAPKIARLASAWRMHKSVIPTEGPTLPARAEGKREIPFRQKFVIRWDQLLGLEPIVIFQRDS